MSLNRMQRMMAGARATVRGTLNVTQKAATYGDQVTQDAVLVSAMYPVAAAAVASEANLLGVTVSNAHLATVAHGAMNAASVMSDAIPVVTLTMGVLGLVAAADDFLASFTRNSEAVKLSDKQLAQHRDKQFAKYLSALEAHAKALDADQKKSKSIDEKASAVPGAPQPEDFGLSDNNKSRTAVDSRQANEFSLSESEEFNLKKATLRSNALYNTALSLPVTVSSYLALSPSHIPAALSNVMTAHAFSALALPFVGLSMRAAVQCYSEWNKIEKDQELTIDLLAPLAFKLLECAGWAAMTFNPLLGFGLLAAASVGHYNKSTLRHDTAANYTGCKTVLFNAGSSAASACRKDSASESKAELTREAREAHQEALSYKQAVLR